MSDKCGHCKKNIEDVKNRVQCVGPCENVYHGECAGLKTDAALKTALKSGWRCQNQTCKYSLRSGSTSGMSEDSMAKMLLELKKEIFSKFDTDFGDIKKSMDFFSSKIDDFTKILNEEREKNKEQQRQFNILKEQHETLTNEVYWLKSEVCDLQQYTRSTNLEISGVPETPNENINTVVDSIAKCIGVQVQPGDVLITHRVPTKSKERPKPIIVQLRSKTERHNWIVAFRKKKDVTCRDFNPNLAPEKFYINEHLTAWNKGLLFECKAFSKKNDYEYTWVSNGKIYIRKKTGSPATRIMSVGDLEEIERKIKKK